MKKPARAEKKKSTVSNLKKEEIKKTVSTRIDEILKALEQGPTDFSKLSKSLKIPECSVLNDVP